MMKYALILRDTGSQTSVCQRYFKYKLKIFYFIKFFNFNNILEIESPIMVSSLKIN